MIIVNSQMDTKIYIVSIGAEDFMSYANSKEEAIEIVAEYFISQQKSDWYFNSLEVELMAESVKKTVEDFANDADLRYCPEHNIYLPKLKIQEVSE
jgi:hypothetical protein